MARKTLTQYPLGECVRYGRHGSEYVDNLPYYRDVPKDYQAQLDYRLRFVEQCAADPDLQQTMWQACRDDPLFWLNTFVWITEPREELVLPFNTWCHQDPVIAAMFAHFGKRDMKCDKSRAQGASWIAIALFCHRFIFYPNSHLGIVSRNMELADDPRNSDSCGWKVDFLFSMLPAWMRPPGLEPGGGKNRNLSEHTWVNERNGSSIKAYAAGPNVARGGRRAAFFFDETAFFDPGSDREAYENLRSVTNCRILMSTPNGKDNLFYEVIHQTDRSLQLVLDWEDNPDQNYGKYCTERGKLKILDPDYTFPDDYPFELDGRVRSPWFDMECERAGNNLMYIDRELRRDYGGSKGRPFTREVTDRCLLHTKPPLHTGTILHHPHDLTDVSWTDGEAYGLRLWVPLRDGLPPRGLYVMGCDIAMGAGGATSSNSSVQVFDAVSREQVAEFADNRIQPQDFADYVLSLCHWFGWDGNLPYLNFEANGGGGSLFSARVIDYGYGNLFFQSNAVRDKIYTKKTDSPGYHNSDKFKTIRGLIDATFRDTITLRSDLLIEEMTQYIFDEKNSGKVLHPKSRTGMGGSGGENHGDRVIAAAIAVMALDDRPRKERAPELDWDRLQAAPEGSVGHRIYLSTVAQQVEVDYGWVTMLDN